MLLIIYFLKILIMFKTFLIMFVYILVKTYIKYLAAIKVPHKSHPFKA